MRFFRFTVDNPVENFSFPLHKSRENAPSETSKFKELHIEDESHIKSQSTLFQYVIARL